MGKLIALLVLGSIGGWVYWHFYYQSPAFLTYVAFEDAAADGDCDRLYSLVEGEAKAWVDDYCTAGGGMLIYGKSILGRSAASMVAEMKGTPAAAMLRSRHDIQSESKANDGSVDLVVVEVVTHQSLRYPAPAPERHEAKLKKMGDAWKIVAYKAEKVAKP